MLAAEPRGPFQHKAHASLKLPCGYCHAAGERPGFPTAERCQTCHPGDTVGAIPSRRVYRVRDYVFFSHARHRAACQECHGDVWQQAVLVQHRPLTMKACVDCHRTNKATLVCAACHELGQ